MENDRRNCGDK